MTDRPTPNRRAAARLLALAFLLPALLVAGGPAGAADKLQEIRQKRAVSERSKAYSIAPDSLLRAIAQRAPASTDDLYDIPGFRSSQATSTCTSGNAAGLAVSPGLNTVALP